MDTFDQARRIRSEWAALVLLILASPAVSVGAERYAAAGVRHGNVFVKLPTGEEKQVTFKGTDSQPILSMDHNRVAFIRASSSEPTNASRTEIWVIQDLAPKAVLAREIEVNGLRFHQFSNPQFSPDQEHLYFEVPYASVTNAVLKLSAATGAVEFVSTAVRWSVVYGGKFTGALVLQQRRAKLVAGFFNWFYLFSPEGKELGVIGENEADVLEFLERFKAAAATPI